MQRGVQKMQKKGVDMAETAKPKYCVECMYCKKKMIVLHESCPPSHLQNKRCPVCHIFGGVMLMEKWTDDDLMNVWGKNLMEKIKDYEKR